MVEKVYLKSLESWECLESLIKINLWKFVDRRKEDMKVLVTGADGFIGSHLTESLLAEGYDVRALSQYNSFNYWGWLEDIQQTSNLVYEFSQINTKIKKVERIKKVDKI